MHHHQHCEYYHYCTTVSQFIVILRLRMRERLSMALADFASLCTIAALLGAVSATLVILINQEQPHPYMVSLSLLCGT